MSKINCVQIELTNLCNYRCVKCPRSAEHLTRQKGMMDIDLAKKVIDEAFQIGTFINFSFFGEPLLHNKIFEILKYTTKKPKGFKIVMNSNMSFATKKILEHFIETKINSLRVSVDAATSALYDIVRPSDYVMTLNGETEWDNRLAAIDEKLKWWFSNPKHISTRHVVPVSSLNKKEIVKYVKKWYKYLGDGDSILLKSVLTYGGKIVDEMITRNACNVWENGVATIDWQGNVSPCNLDTNMDLIIGNITDKPLKEVWGNKKHKELEKLSKQKKIFPCNQCVDANNYTKNITITKRNNLNEKTFRVIEKTFKIV